MILPYTTVMKKLAGISWLQSINVSATSSADMDAAQTQISALLRQRHHLRSSEPDDFIIRSPTDIAQARAQTLGVMELLLACIASVSLIVGGIGIMNIMLVSVTERTREIGVRMALGAQRRDMVMLVLRQGLLAVLGGVALGIAISAVLTRFLASMLFEVKPLDPATFMLVPVLLVGVAVLACWLPARRARLFQIAGARRAQHQRPRRRCESRHRRFVRSRSSRRFS